MAILEGIFGFAAKPRGDMGAAIAGRLLRFATKAGRVVSSLISVDASGNLSTPGRVDAAYSSDGSARVSSTGTGVNHFATFGHSAAATPALKQRVDGTTSLYGYAAILGAVAAKIPFYATDQGVRCQGPTGGNTGPDLNMALQVAGGFFFLPRLDATARDTMTTATGLDSDFAGVMCFNTTAGRVELWDGSAWVGLTTEP